MISKTVTTTNEGITSDIIFKNKEYFNLLRTIKYIDEETVNLMCYSCALSENATEKNLMWNINLSHTDAKEFAESILEIYK